MTFLHAVILGLIEGMTEFLPVSSTGHMILLSSAFGIGADEFVKTFEIFIQLGAILAIVFMYAKRYIKTFELYKKLFVAFIPTAIIGFALYKVIKMFLFSPIVVAISLIVGGVILVLVEKQKWFHSDKEEPLENISYKNAAIIGLIQSLSVIPGVSRAAATIIGGMSRGLSKKQATEFSFLLAIPTMAAATGFDLVRADLNFDRHALMLLGIGFVVAAISAWFTVKLFLKFIEKSGFALFGYYRIVLGTIFIIYFLNK